MCVCLVGVDVHRGQPESPNWIPLAANTPLSYSSTPLQTPLLAGRSACPARAFTLSLSGRTFGPVFAAPPSSYAVNSFCERTNMQAAK